MENKKFYMTTAIAFADELPELCGYQGDKI